MGEGGGVGGESEWEEEEKEELCSTEREARLGTNGGVALDVGSRRRISEAYGGVK